MRLTYLILLIYFFSNVGCSQSNYWNTAGTLTSLTPIVQLDKKMVETSALVQHQGSYWTINDSGDASYIYEINQNNGGVQTKVEILDAKNKDWESLTMDDQYLYIGDIGNNNGDRAKLTIYKVELDQLKSGVDNVKSTGKITFSYPDDKRNYDCEAMIIMNNQLWLFTKNRKGLDTHAYSIPLNEGHYTAKYEGAFQCDGLVTAATYKNEKLTLLGYTAKPNYLPFVWEFEKFNVNRIFKGKKKGALLPKVLQFEAILAGENGTYFLTNEGNGKNKKPGLWLLLSE